MQKFKKVLLKIKYFLIDALNLIKKALKSKSFFYIEDIVTLIFALCGMTLLDNYIPYNAFGVILAILLTLIAIDIVINIINDFIELFKIIVGAIMLKIKKSK